MGKMPSSFNSRLRCVFVILSAVSLTTVLFVFTTGVRRFGYEELDFPFAVLVPRPARKPKPPPLPFPRAPVPKIRYPAVKQLWDHTVSPSNALEEFFFDLYDRQLSGKVPFRGLMVSPLMTGPTGVGNEIIAITNMILYGMLHNATVFIHPACGFKDAHPPIFSVFRPRNSRLRKLMKYPPEDEKLAAMLKEALPPHVVDRPGSASLKIECVDTGKGYGNWVCPLEQVAADSFINPSPDALSKYGPLGRIEQYVGPRGFFAVTNPEVIHRLCSEFHLCDGIRYTPSRISSMAAEVEKNEGVKLMLQHEGWLLHGNILRSLFEFHPRLDGTFRKINKRLRGFIVSVQVRTEFIAAERGARLLSNCIVRTLEKDAAIAASKIVTFVVGGDSSVAVKMASEAIRNATTSWRQEVSVFVNEVEAGDLKERHIGHMIHASEEVKLGSVWDMYAFMRANLTIMTETSTFGAFGHYFGEAGKFRRALILPATKRQCGEKMMIDSYCSRSKELDSCVLLPATPCGRKQCPLDYRFGPYDDRFYLGESADGLLLDW